MTKNKMLLSSIISSSVSDFQKYLVKMIKWHIEYFSNKWKIPRRLVRKSDDLKAACQEWSVECILFQNALWKKQSFNMQEHFYTLLYVSKFKKRKIVLKQPFKFLQTYTIFIEVQLIHNVTVVSEVQCNDSVLLQIIL